MASLPSLRPLWAGSSWTFNGSGSWSVASNWLGGVPANGADVFIVQADATSRTITYDYTGTAVTLDDLKVDNTGGGPFTATNTLSQSANSLGAAFEYIALGGKGAYTQSGGTNTFNSFLLVGDHAGSTGTYTLSAGTLSGTGTGAGPQVMNVGNEGNGTFIQSGGTVTLASDVALNIGDATTAFGTYLLSGSGVLNVLGVEAVGNGGPGMFIQTGGTHSVSGLSLGSYGNVNQGTYMLGSGTSSSPALSVLQDEAIGDLGRGTFIQTGGTHTIGFRLLLGADLSTGSPVNAGTYILSGGSLNVLGSEYIGYNEIGNFIQTGGTNTVGSPTLSANMELGYGINISESVGTYALSGTGQATIYGNVYVNGNDFEQNQGTGSGYLAIGGGGTASGGSMVVTGLLKIWQAPSIVIGGKAGVNLGTGGFLSIGSLDTSGQSSLFQWSGGTLQVAFNLDEGGSQGIFGPSPVDNAAKTLITAGGLTIESSGAFNLPVGALIIPSASTASNGGMFNQTGGLLTVNGAFVNSGTANFGGTQNWGFASVFVNLAGVSTFSSTLGPTGPIVVITGGSVAFNAPLHLQSLTLTSAPASLSTGGDKTLVVNSLAITGSGKLDLANNDMVIDYSGPVGTLVDDVRQHVQAGRLTSSAADPSHRLGYADNALLGLTSFGGQPVDSSSLLVKYTYAGDANLDGKVDIADVRLLANDWNQTGVWSGGDFNYDGVVNVADLLLLAKDWQDGVNSPLAASLSAVLSNLGLPDVTIPEPIGIGALALAISSLKRPRRRRRAASTM